MRSNLKTYLEHQFPSNSALHELYVYWAARGAPFVIDSKTTESQFERNLSLEEALVLSLHWGRSDWRLLEGLLVWLWDRWRLPHPSTLNKIIHTSAQPAVWGVIFEWTLLRSSEMSDAHRAFWILVLEDIKPAAGELFFREGKIQSFQKTRRLLIHQLPLYERWGFMGDQLPSIGAWKRLKKEPGPAVRKRILRDLLLRGTVTLSSYLEALDHSISRQTAWRDLRSFKKLSARGRTRSRRYQLR